MAFTFVCFTCMAQVEADASAPRRKYRVVYVLAITCLRLSPDGSLTDFQRAVLALFVLLACLGLCRCLVGSFILFGSHALLARVAAASRRNNFREASREDWFVVSPTACQATPRPCKWKRVDSRARQSFALRRRGSGWRHQLLPNYRNCRPPVARPFHTQPWSARGGHAAAPHWSLAAVITFGSLPITAGSDHGTDRSRRTPASRSRPVCQQPVDDHAP